MQVGPCDCTIFIQTEVDIKEVIAIFFLIDTSSYKEYLNNKDILIYKHLYVK